MSTLHHTMACVATSPAAASLTDVEKKAAALRAEKKDAMRKRRGAKNHTVVPTPSSIAGLAAQLYAGGEDELHAATALRVMLDVENQSPVDMVIAASPPVVPKLVELLSHSNPQLQHDAVWALTNIAAGTTQQTDVVVQHGALPPIIRMLSSSNNDLQEYAACCLGNIACDNINMRDMALDAGALQPLLASLHVGAPLKVKRYGTYAVSNLLRGKPAVQQSAVRAAVPVLSHLISVDDTETVFDALWGLSSACKGSNYCSRIQTVLDSGVLPRVISKLADENYDICYTALRVVANLVTGNNDQTQTVLDAGAALAIRKLLSVPQKDEVTKECLWLIRSVAGGTPSQLQHLINLDFTLLVVDLITSQQLSTEVMRGAVCVLRNAMEGGTKEHRTAFFNEGFVPAFVACLKHSGSCAEADKVSLKGLEFLMEHGTTLSGSGDNPCVSAAVDAGIVDALRSCASNGRHVIAFAKKWFPLASELESCLRKG